MELFVAKLDSQLNEESLKKIFEVFGDVTSIHLVRDKVTRESKCFGFISMDNAIEAQRAIDELNGREIAGRNIVVKEAENRGNKPVNPINQNNEPENTDEIFLKKGFSGDKHIGEEIPIEVIDEAKFTTQSDGEFVRVKFSTN